MASGNSLGQLNDFLFLELERLISADVRDEAALRLEVERARSVAGIAQAINTNAGTVLRTVELQAQIRGTQVAVPKMLGGD